MNASPSSGGLVNYTVKTYITDPHPKDSYFVGWGWVPKFCTSNNFPGNAGAAYPDTIPGVLVI